MYQFHQGKAEGMPITEEGPSETSTQMDKAVENALSWKQMFFNDLNSQYLAVVGDKVQLLCQISSTFEEH